MLHDALPAQLLSVYGGTTISAIQRLLGKGINLPPQHYPQVGMLLEKGYLATILAVPSLEAVLSNRYTYVGAASSNNV
eukprot:scaffold76156_cov40-Prasinocladus_malaysianus.AAC.1